MFPNTVVCNRLLTMYMGLSAIALWLNSGTTLYGKRKPEYNKANASTVELAMSPFPPPKRNIHKTVTGVKQIPTHGGYILLNAARFISCNGQKTIRE